MKLPNFKCLLPFILLLLSISSKAQVKTPIAGTYEGSVGNDRFILITESADSTKLKGYFIYSRGKAVEESHAFSVDFSVGKPFFQSDLFVGPLKSAKIDSTSMNGILTLMNKKKRFLFWRQKTNLSFARRPDEVQVIPSDRYQKEIFPGAVLKSDVIYGKAKGLWTNSPYSDDPYIEVLGKGMVKSFSDPEMLDLKMDIYYPKTDVFKNRPLVMLIHGGAFYIGSKESACERSLATSLAKRGYLVASIDYRLGFKPLASDIELSAYRALQDAHAALRFLSHNAAGLGIDPNQVYVGGTSAGAIASLNVAFMDNDERPKRIVAAEKEGTVTRIEASGNKYTESFTIKAVANMWGAVADLNLIDKKDKISVLSIHGTADQIVPYGYDHPFQNSLMVNRLLMDKMYGSKPIHERLSALGNRNRLVSLPGLGHEPELIGASRLNQYMDTITNQVSRFFYEETAPSIKVSDEQLTISPDSDLKPIGCEVLNGELVQVGITGGVRISNDPTDTRIIWVKNSHKHELTVLAKNKYEAWNRRVFSVTLGK